MGHNSVVSSHPKSIGIPWVEGLSIGPSDLERHMLLLTPLWIPWVAKYIFCSLISWVDSLDFVDSYLLVDSLSYEVSIYPSNIYSSHHLFFRFSITNFSTSIQNFPNLIPYF